MTLPNSSVFQEFRSKTTNTRELHDASIAPKGVEASQNEAVRVFLRRFPYADFVAYQQYQCEMADPFRARHIRYRACLLCLAESGWGAPMSFSVLSHRFCRWVNLAHPDRLAWHGAISAA